MAILDPDLLLHVQEATGGELRPAAGVRPPTGAVTECRPASVGIPSGG